VYGKKIELGSTSIGERKLKADLRGLSFDKVLQVICTSLNLDYTDKNGIIVLKDKENK
jgi:transmembrane sensor